MQIPLFKPQTEWLPPENFPDLSKYDEIAIDLETKDPDLMKMGSGSVVGKGDVTGIAVAVPGWSGYYPIAHEGGGNMDKSVIVDYIKEVCEDESIQKVFHNAQYDIGWLSTLGIEVRGYIHDTMIAAALLNENRYSFTLNSMVAEYLGEFKNESLLKAKAEELGLDPKADMYKMHASFVGEYAEADARLTWRLHERFITEIEKEDLTKVYDIECRLIRVIFNMTKRGVRVDMEKAFGLKKKLLNKEKQYLKRIKDL